MTRVEKCIANQNKYIEVIDKYIEEATKQQQKLYRQLKQFPQDVELFVNHNLEQDKIISLLQLKNNIIKGTNATVEEIYAEEDNIVNLFN